MVTINIPAEEAIRQIQARIDAIDEIPKSPQGIEYYDFIRWCSNTWQTIDGIYGSDHPHAEELRLLGLQNCSCNAHMEALILAGAYHARLQAFIDEIRGSVPECG